MAVRGTVYPPRTQVLTILQDAADAEFPGVANIFVSREGKVRPGAETEAESAVTGVDKIGTVRDGGFLDWVCLLVSAPVVALLVFVIARGVA